MTPSDWKTPSTWLVALLGLYMFVNALRAWTDPAGFADYMGLALADPANDAFVRVYALRALFIGLVALALLVRRETTALAVFAALAIVMPVGDTILTLSHGASTSTVSRHVGAAILLAVTAALLVRRARSDDGERRANRELG